MQKNHRPEAALEPVVVRAGGSPSRAAIQLLSAPVRSTSVGTPVRNLPHAPVTMESVTDERAPHVVFRVFPPTSYLSVLCSEPVRSAIILEAHAQLYLPAGHLLKLARAQRLPFKTGCTGALEPLEQTHGDLVGPMPIESVVAHTVSYWWTTTRARVGYCPESKIRRTCKTGYHGALHNGTGWRI